MNAAKLKEAFGRAVQLHQSGRLQEAEPIYRQILLRHPGNADALHMLGILAWQTGRHELAADMIRQAIARRPLFPEAHYNLGNALRDQGKLIEAVAAYRQAIALKPSFLKAHSNLGVLLAHMGQTDEAIASHRSTIAIEPSFPDAHYNLANALRDKGELDASIAAYRHATVLRPDFADAFYNLGNALSAQGQLEEAIAAFRQAIMLNPKLQSAYGNLSVALRAQGRLDDAVEICRQAIAALPDTVECYCNLADALQEKGQLDQVIEVYRQAIARDANWVAAHRGLAHTLERQGNIGGAVAAFKAVQKAAGSSANYDFELAALGVGNMPRAAPPQYIVGFFNNFADNFDQHLRQLQYIGPQLLLNAVIAAAPSRPLDIIDLGCGTGLCGPLFRPMARHLVGIDLAPRMLDKARRRGVYDDLKQQSIALALQEHPQGYDLILAADVFVYVGSLDEVFAAAATALRPGGLLAFTIESTDAGDYILQSSRRYAQSVEYIRRLAIECGLTEVSIQDAVLRTECNIPVEGKVIVLQSQRGHA